MGVHTYVLLIREYDLIGGFTQVLVVESPYNREYVKQTFEEICKRVDVDDLLDALRIAEDMGLFKVVTIDDTITVVI